MITAWLIERKDMPLCYSNGSCPWVTFTDAAAWRFPTKEAAEAVIAQRRVTDVFPSSHGWV